MQAPGPSLAEVLRDTPKILTRRLEWMVELQKKYGDIVRIPFGPRISYAVFHPDLFRHVLVAQSKKYCKGRTFEKASGYLGKGLATSEGPPWQMQRRRMNPHFQREALEGVSRIMFQTIEKMIGRWTRLAQEDEIVDLSLEFQRLALEVVARSLFGVEVPEKEIGNIIDAFKEALIYTTKRTINPFDIPESLPLPGNLRFKKAIQLLDHAVYGFIETENRRVEPSHTLLSILVRAEDPETGQRMSEKQLRDEILTLFLGGTDTSGNTMTWILYYLQILPEIQKRLRQEVIDILGERTPEWKDLPNLGFLRRVAEETLRLRPQNWTMSRDSLENDVIAGYDIPAGSTVFLGVYVAHRRPDFWENAEKFDPDRFLPEKLVGRHSLAYIPFGAGPRKCIGYQFALMEFSFAISRILQKFDFELLQVEKVKCNPTWSLWPKPAIRAKLSLRKHGVQPGLRVSADFLSEQKKAETQPVE